MPIQKPPPLPNGLPRRTYRVDEIALMLHVSEQTVYRMLQRDPAHGGMAWIPAMSMKLVPCEEFERWLRDNQQFGAA
jgi:hypothetical protein